MCNMTSPLVGGRMLSCTEWTREDKDIAGTVRTSQGLVA